MRKASAPTLFLVGLLVLAVTAGATFGIGSLAGLDDDEVAAGAAPPDGGDNGDNGDDDEPTPTSDPALRATQVAVTGTATGIVVEGAVVEGMEVVLATITTPAAGMGSGASFADVVVGGDAAAITWDAGRPLDFGDATPLRMRPRAIDLLAGVEGVIVGFPEGEAVPIVPGDYEIDAPVAVTTTGLGRPRDSVTFTATEASTVAFTGDAGGVMAVQPIAATGPGRVELRGAFTVRRADGTRTEATTVSLPSGSFRLRLTPTADGLGYALDDVLLEGEVVAS